MVEIAGHYGRPAEVASLVVIVTDIDHAFPGGVFPEFPVWSESLFFPLRRATPAPVFVGQTPLVCSQRPSYI